MRRLLLALLAALALPAGANAATVSTAGFGKHSNPGVNVADADGETNRWRITGTGGTIEVREEGDAPLVAAERCAQVDPRTVRCANVNHLAVSAGDGDDHVDVALPRERFSDIQLLAGPGNDTVTSGATDDYLDGGGGRDRLSAGGGDDGISDGDLTGAADGDAVDGGEGIDVVLYWYRQGDVEVQLDAAGAAPSAGEVGEGDALTGMEGAVGGEGDDVLRASDAPAAPPPAEPEDDYIPGLDGGGGDDLLIGGASADVIQADAGRDRVRAGAGRDIVLLRDRDPRAGVRVDCGPGRDQVNDAARRDLLRACESIAPVDGLGFFALAPLARGGLRPEPRTFDEPATVAVRVEGGRHGGRLIARRRYERRAGPLRATALARRLARRGARPRLQVTIRRGRQVRGFRLAR